MAQPGQRRQVKLEPPGAPPGGCGCGRGVAAQRHKYSYLLSLSYVRDCVGDEAAWMAVKVLQALHWLGCCFTASRVTLLSGAPTLKAEGKPLPGWGGLARPT